MLRRDFIRFAGGSIVLLSPNSWAQHPARAARVAMLWHAASAEEEAPYLDAFRLGLKELGYVEGKNIVLELRFPNEEPDKFRSMAAELAALKPDVLVSGGAAASIAAKNATSTIPIVFGLVQDPMSAKLVTNLARPGGNVTGLTNFSLELCGKRLEYLKEGVPGLSRVGLLVNPNVPITAVYIRESEQAAAALGLTVQPFHAKSLDELEPTFNAMAKAKMQAVCVNAEGLFFQARHIVPKLALARRLPMCVYSRETFEPGSLMSYGPDQPAIFRKAAHYVDKILKGAKPGELAVEQPSKFEFLINLRTAKALGLQVPNSLLIRANEVVTS